MYIGNSSVYSSLFFSNKFIKSKDISFALDFLFSSNLLIPSLDTCIVKEFLFPASTLPYLSLISPLGAFIGISLYVLFLKIGTTIFRLYKSLPVGQFTCISITLKYIKSKISGLWMYR